MNKTQERLRRRELRLYGVKKIKRGQKLAWISKQSKNGWSLGLAYGKYTMWLRSMFFASQEEVNRVVGGDTKVVFFPLKHPSK